MACVKISFLLFIHSSVDGHLGCSYLSAVVNHVAMNVGVQIPLLVPAFSSLGCIHTSGIAGSYSNSSLIF